MRIINSEFNEFAKNPDLDLYPEDTREVINNVNSWVYSSLNDGVYNCGLAESQGAYEAAIGKNFHGFSSSFSLICLEKCG